MKLEEFKFLFPNADPTKFEEVEDHVVFEKLDDIEEPSFWESETSVKYLNLPYIAIADYELDKHGFLRKYKKMREFKVDYNKVVPLSWKPREWSQTPDSLPDDIVLKLQNVNFNSFRVYVNDKDFFMLNDTLPDFSNVTKIDFKDSKNVYCLSLKAMYVLSYLGGVSLQNLNYENNLAKSLAYFYFYYHLKKFYNYRNFSGYDTSPVEKIPWSLYSWQHHFIWYHSNIHYTSQNLKRTKDEVVANIHRDKNKLRYGTRLGKRDIFKDYLKLINNEGKGLTKIGATLFQESTQAYVYCVLGAQAKTRWKIIGDGANSYQTQRLFQSLVEEVIAQNNLSTLIKSMRLAINQTKVKLDFCISPGLELIPSSMVYIKDSPGYNNILLISSSNQKFGVNTNVNTSLKRVESDQKVPLTKETQMAIRKKPVGNEVGTSNAPILVSGLLVAVVGRLVGCFDLK